MGIFSSLSKATGTNTAQKDRQTTTVQAPAPAQTVQTPAPAQTVQTPARQSSGGMFSRVSSYLASGTQTNNLGNLFSHKSAEISPELQQTTRGTLASIQQMNQTNPTGARSAMDMLKQLQSDPSSRYFNPYKKATNRAVDALAELGFDVSNIDDNWFDQNAWLKQYFVPTANTNSLSTTMTGKKSTPEQQAAYYYNQLDRTRADTQAAQSEREKLNKYISYWAAQKDRNYSDDEILGMIGWKDGIPTEKFKKDYPTLYKMEMTRRQGTPMELNSAVDFSLDGLYGTMWAARNGGSTGNPYQDMINSVTENNYTDNAEIRAKRTRASSGYAPYSLGSTMDKERALFGQDSFTREWVSRNMGILDTGTDEEKEAFISVMDAMDKTEKADKELDKLKKYLDRKIASSDNPEEVISKLDNQLTSGEYPTLVEMDRDMSKGNERLMKTTWAVDYSRGTMEQYIRDSFANKPQEKNGEETVSAFNALPPVDPKDVVFVPAGKPGDIAPSWQNRVATRNVQEPQNDPIGQFGLGNIDLNNRPVVVNPDGTISTEKSFSVGIDGKEVLLPTIINGKEVSEDEAIRHYEETGEYLGKFDTVEEAEAYAEQLHLRQEQRYGTGAKITKDNIVSSAGPTTTPSPELRAALQPGMAARAKTDNVLNKKIQDAVDALAAGMTDAEKKHLEDNPGIEFSRTVLNMGMGPLNPAMWQDPNWAYNNTERLRKQAEDNYVSASFETAAIRTRYENIQKQLQAGEAKEEQIRSQYGQRMLANEQIPESVDVTLNDVPYELQDITLDYNQKTGEYELYGEITPYTENVLAANDMTVEQYLAAVSEKAQALNERAAGIAAAKVKYGENPNLPTQEELDALTMENQRLRDTMYAMQPDYETAVSSLTAASNRRNRMADVMLRHGDAVPDPSKLDAMLKFAEGFTGYKNPPATPDTLINQIKSENTLENRSTDFSGMTAELDESIKDIEYCLDNLPGMPQEYRDAMQTCLDYLNNQKTQIDLVKYSQSADFDKWVEKGKQIEADYVWNNEEGRPQIIGQRKELREFMTPTELDIYYALLGQYGVDRADAFYNSIEDSLELRPQQIIQENAAEQAETAGGRILNTAVGIGLAPLEVVTSVLDGIYTLVNGEGSTWLEMPGTLSKTAFNESIKGVENAYGPGLKSDIIKGIYEIAFNVGRSRMVAGTFGGLIPEVSGNDFVNSVTQAMPIATIAFNDTLQKAIDDGVEPWKAGIMATVSFISESFTEGIELKRWKDALATGQNLTKNALVEFIKGYMPEAVSEVLGESLNDISEKMADYLLDENGEIRSLIREYEQGHTDEEAFDMMLQDQLADLMHTAAISFFSPGTEVANLAAGYIQSYSAYREQAKALQQSGQANMSIRDVRKATNDMIRADREFAKTIDEMILKRPLRGFYAAEESKMASLRDAWARAIRADNPAENRMNEYDFALSALEGAALSDKTTRTATIAAVLGTDETNAPRAAAAAVELSRILGNDASDTISQLMAGGITGDVNIKALKLGIQYAALGKGWCYNTMQNDTFKLLPPDQQAQLLAGAVIRDEQDAGVQKAVNDTVHDFRVNEEIKNMMASEEADDAVAAHDAANRASQTAREAEALHEEKQGDKEVAQNNLKAAEEEFQRDPQAGAPGMTNAINKLNSTTAVEEEYAQKEKASQEAEKAAKEKEKRLAETKMAALRQQAEARVAEQEELEAQQAAEMEALERQKAIEAQALTEAEESRDNAVGADVEDFIARTNPDATEEEKAHIREVFLETQRRMTEERQAASQNMAPQEQMAADIQQRAEERTKFLNQVANKFNLNGITEVDPDNETDPERVAMVSRLNGGNGYYDSETNSIVLNKKASVGDAMYFVLGHELTHVTEAAGEYRQMADRLLGLFYGKGTSFQGVLDEIAAGASKSPLARQVLAKKSTYDNALGRDHSAEYCLQEVVADCMGRLLRRDAQHPEAQQNLINQLVAEEPSTARKILDSIKSFLKKLVGARGAWQSELQQTVQMFETALQNAQAVRNAPRMSWKDRVESAGLKVEKEGAFYRIYDNDGDIEGQVLGDEQGIRSYPGNPTLLDLGFTERLRAEGIESLYTYNADQGTALPLTDRQGNETALQNEQQTVQPQTNWKPPVRASNSVKGKTTVVRMADGGIRRFAENADDIAGRYMKQYKTGPGKTGVSAQIQAIRNEVIQGKDGEAVMHTLDLAKEIAGNAGLHRSNRAVTELAQAMNEYFGPEIPVGQAEADGLIRKYGSLTEANKVLANAGVKARITLNPTFQGRALDEIYSGDQYNSDMAQRMMQLAVSENDTPSLEDLIHDLDLSDTDQHQAFLNDFNQGRGATESELADTIFNSLIEDVFNSSAVEPGQAQPLTDRQGNETAAEELRGGTAVLDTTRYSLNSFTPEEQRRTRQALLNVKDANGNPLYNPQQVDKYMWDAMGIASMIAMDRTRLDYDVTDPEKSMVKPNADYGASIDASTLCAKRLLYQGTFDAIQHALPNTALTPGDLIVLANMMRDMGYETPCGICYVESRRRILGQEAQKWLDGYTGEYKPKIEDLTTSDGLEALRNEHPQAYDDFIEAMKKLNQRNPKVVQLRTEYRGEIRDMSDTAVQKAIDHGGLRLQSFSDFETPHLLDMIQVIYDMASKGLTSQAYTKVPNFAWAFGDTGVKINLSEIAKDSGYTIENGLTFKELASMPYEEAKALIRLAYDDVEGMKHDEAIALRNRYSKNVGTILVGKSDAHIIAAMADSEVDFIIPFHRSGWTKKERNLMETLKGYQDYTNDQNERKIQGRKPNGKGYKTVPAAKSGIKNFEPVGEKSANGKGRNGYWDFSKSGRENAETYLQMCAEDKRIPKFSRFLVDNGDGSFSLPQGDDYRSTAIREGYWKTLIDFKMYDNDNVGSPQTVVTPNVNMDQARRILDDYSLDRNGVSRASNNALPVAQTVVDRFVEEYKKNHPLGGSRIRYSLPDDTSYMTAVERGDMKAAAEDVESYAASKGYTEKVFHGTRNFGFTEFDTNLRDEKSNEFIFVSHTPSVARTYTDNGKIREIFSSPGTADEIRNALAEMNDSDLAETATSLLEDQGQTGYTVQPNNDGTFMLQPKDQNRRGSTITRDRLINQITQGSNYSGIYQLYARPGKQMVVDAKGAKWSEISVPWSDTPVKTDDIAEYAKANGYDSVRINNVHDTGKGTGAFDQDAAVGDISAYFNKDDVKSADTITYDDQGNVLPLGERFNPQTPDIRYSLPADAPYMAAVERGEMDRAQEEVSAAAEQAMQNSKVRDEEGRLLTVYHGTTEDFTVFDMSKGRSTMDIQGAFFSPYDIEASGYGDKVGSYYLNITNPAPEGIAYATLNKYKGQNEAGTKAREDLISMGYDGVENYDEYIAFYPEQIKSADPVTYDYQGNVIPLSERFRQDNNDIRYSIPDDTVLEQQIREYLRNGGSLSRNPGPSLSQASLPMDGRDPMASFTSGPKQRQFGARTAQASDELAAQAKAWVRANNAYMPDTNAEQIDRAIAWIRGNKIEPNSDGLYESVQAIQAPDFDYMSADGQARMAAVMGLAVAKNDIMTQTLMADAFNRQGTDLGRALQSRKIFRLMTPAGRIATLQKMLKNVEQELGAQGKLVDLTFPDWILTAASTATTEEEFNYVQKSAAQHLASKIPVNWKDKLTAWRMLSMLGNPRTHVRNVLGNFFFMPAVGLKNKIGAALEIVTRQEERTKTLGLASKEARAFAKLDAQEMEAILRGDAKYKDGNQIQQERKIFGQGKGIISRTAGKMLQGLSDFNSKMLENEDWIFLSRHYQNALAGYMTANKLTTEQMTGETLEKARVYAVQEAQKATYRDANAVASWLNEANRKHPGIGFVVNAVLPFKKTPANILKRGVEYSPVGLINALTRGARQLHMWNAYQNGELKVLPDKAISPTQFIDKLAAGLTGTGIMALGALLSHLGVATAGLDDDDDEFDKLRGGQEYSLTLPTATLFGHDVSFTVDWAAPTCMPFFVGATIMDIAKRENKDVSVAGVLDSILGITEPVFNLSMLDGVNSLFNVSQYAEGNPITQVGEKILTNYATSYVPTFVGQVARTLDTTRRKAYVESGADLSTWRYALEGLENKLPWVSQNNIPYRNVWGEADVSGTGEAAIENFISPGYGNAIKNDPVVNELERIYRETGDKALIPKAASKTIGTTKLNAEQYDRYVVSRGQTARETLEALMESPLWQICDDPTRAKMVSDAWAYANQISQHEITGKKMDAWVMEASTAGTIVETLVSRAADNNRKTYLAEYGKSLAEALDQEDSEAYNTCLAALENAEATNTNIKSSLRDYFKPLYQSAYMDGDRRTMEEIEEKLIETGTGFKTKDFEGWIPGNKDEDEESDNTKWLTTH